MDKRGKREIKTNEAGKMREKTNRRHEKRKKFTD